MTSALLMSVTRTNALQSLIPPERLALSEWFETHLVLPDGVSAHSGMLRLYPFQREIADEISNPETTKITLQKPVRIGFTTLLTGAIGSFSVNDPASILVVVPTFDDARRYVVKEIEPIFAATPVLKTVLEDEGPIGDRNILLSRRFSGGSLTVVSAKTPRNLRAHTARVLICDEIDAMPPTNEGDPIALAENRTLTFVNRKIIIGSTPTLEGESAVAASYARSDMRIYTCPCPSCGAFTEILWPMIEWTKDEAGNHLPETAAFRCPECKELISEDFKYQMVHAGVWRKTHPEVVGHAGFRINALVSLLENMSWAALAQRWLDSKGDSEMRQSFVNTVLAETWQPQSEVNVNAIASRGERFDLVNLPPEVLAITAGVDVQDDRLEICFTGWSKDGTCFVLHHEVIQGSFTDRDTWRRLDEFVMRQYQHPLGGKMPIDAMVVDCSDGDHTPYVLNYSKSRRSRRVFAGKGMWGSRVPFAMSKNKSSDDKFAIIGVDPIKSQIFEMLRHGRGLRFSDTLEAWWYEQLGSERRVIKKIHGRPVRKFERIGRQRAEALDALTYAIAAWASVKFRDFAKREAFLRSGNVPPSSAIPEDGEIDTTPVPMAQAPAGGQWIDYDDDDNTVNDSPGNDPTRRVVHVHHDNNTNPATGRPVGDWMKKGF
jgi:phage terminase large subunit GpA-like protein